MNDDGAGLFDLPQQAVPAIPEAEEARINPEQIARLRVAFDAAGITSMDERQAIIENCTIRPVASIRDLLARDVRPIMKRIEQRTSGTGATTGSAWDNRDENTWIDRL